MKGWWVGGVLLLSVQGLADTGVTPLDGRATMKGEVLAAGCSIALPDRDQTVSLGPLPIRALGQAAERRVTAFHIRLDNCVPSGTADRHQGDDPAVRIRFDGLRGENATWFQPVGAGRGMALLLKNEHSEVIYPGAYSRAIFDRSHNQQGLNFTLELVPDGAPLRAGDYSAALRFNVVYE